MSLKYVSAKAFTFLILLIAFLNAEEVLTQAADQNKEVSLHSNFITKFSLRWWQQYVLITWFSSISSVFSNFLSWFDIKMHFFNKIFSITLFKCWRKYSHDLWDFDFITAQINSVFCLLTLMMTARRSNCIKWAFKKISSTAKKWWQRKKEAQDCAEQMKQLRKLPVI